MKKKDYYKILALDPKANQKAIKSAFRQLALKYHPDHNPGSPTAAQIFRDVKEAYECLSELESRNLYDLTYKPSPVNSVEKDTPPIKPKDGAKAATTKEKKGKNLRYNLFINLEDVAKGCERGIRYIRKNNGSSETVQLKVKVPKGAFHQQRLKLSGYGDLDKNKDAGDLFVIIQLQNHPLFLLDGLNLRVNVPIRYIDVVLGATVEVPTLVGIRKLKLKTCDFDGLDHFWPRLGLPHSKSGDVGELHVHCFVEHPKSLNKKDRDSLEKSSKTWPSGEMMQQYTSYLDQLKNP